MLLTLLRSPSASSHSDGIESTSGQFSLTHRLPLVDNGNDSLSNLQDIASHRTDSHSNLPTISEDGVYSPSAILETYPTSTALKLTEGETSYSDNFFNVVFDSLPFSIRSHKNRILASNVNCKVAYLHTNAINTNTTTNTSQETLRNYLYCAQSQVVCVETTKGAGADNTYILHTGRSNTSLYRSDSEEENEYENTYYEDSDDTDYSCASGSVCYFEIEELESYDPGDLNLGAFRWIPFPAGIVEPPDPLDLHLGLRKRRGFRI